MDEKLEKEKELIEACKKDITAFKKLYKKYINEVYRYIFVVVKNKEIAEDIASQTFLTAIEKVKDFEWRGISIKYWFFKIARNLVSKQISKPKDISFDEKYEIKNLDRMLIEDIVIEEELKNKLKELIFRLDDTTREIISLRIWENLKFKEISKLIEMKQVTVISRFARGVKKLQRMLENDIKETQEKREKGKKLYSVNLVLIVVGIRCLKRIPEFLPTKEFISNLAKQITNRLNLIVRRDKMKGIKKVFKTSKAIKIATFLIALITLGGISLTVYLTYRDDDKVEPSDVTQEQDTNEVSSEENDENESDIDPDDIDEEFQEVKLFGTAEDFYEEDGKYYLELKTGSFKSCEHLGYNKCPHDFFWDDTDSVTYTHEISSDAEITTHYYYILTPDEINNDIGRGDCTAQANDVKVTIDEFGTVWETCIKQSEPDPSPILIVVINNKITNIKETRNSSDPDDPYEGWKTYTSDTCKISFKYPSDWYDNTSYSNNPWIPDCAIVATFEGNAGTSLGKVPGVQISVRLWESKDIIITGLNNPWDYYDYLITTPAGSEVTKTSKQIDEEEVLFVTDSDPVNGTVYELHYESGGNYYFVAWGGTEVESLQATIDLILESIDIL